MTHHNQDRREVRARLRAILKALSQVKDPNEEERLLNEQLYLRGVLAGLTADEARTHETQSMKTRRTR